MTYKHLILCILIVLSLYEISGMRNTALPTTILNEDNELPTTSSGNDVIDTSETGSGSSNTVYSTHTPYIDEDIIEEHFRTPQTSTNLGALLPTSASRITNSTTSTLDTSISEDLQQSDLIDTKPTSPSTTYEDTLEEHFRTPQTSTNRGALLPTSASRITNSPTSTLDTSTSEDLQQSDLIDTSPTSPSKTYSTIDGEVTRNRILTSENAFISNTLLASSSTPSSSLSSTPSTPVGSFNKKDLQPAIKNITGSFINDSCFCLKWKLVNNVDYFRVNISGVVKNVTSHKGDTYNTTVCGKGVRQGKKMRVKLVGVRGENDLFEEKDAILTNPPSSKNLEYIPENNKLNWQEGIGKTDEYEIQIKSTKFNINTTTESTTYVLNSTLALPGDHFNVNVTAVRFYKGRKQIMKSGPLSFEFTKKPDPPQNISLRVSNITCIQVSWSSGFGYRDGYSLSLNNNPTYTISVDRTNNQETFNKTFCQLKPCQDYQIQIQTISNTITSTHGWPNTIQTDPLECSISIKNITESSLIVECSNLLNVDNVTYIRHIGTVDNSSTTSSTTSVQEITGLQPATDYTLTVQTEFNGCNTTNTTSFTTLDGKSSGVQNLTLTSDGTNLSVTWTPPETPNGNITSYTITLVDLDSKDTIVNKTQTDIIFDYTVVYGSQYKIRVVPVNGAGLGEATEEGITIPEGISSSVANLKLTLNDTKLWVKWSAPERPNGNITSYNIILVNLDSNTTIIRITTNYWIEYEVSYGSQYKVTVVPVNGAGLGEATEEGITIPEGISSSVTNLKLTLNDTKLWVKWSAPERPNGNITSYNIILVNLDSNTTITNITMNHWIEYEVSYGNCYNVSVIPINGAGPGELSYETITIQSEEPSPVRELQALDVTSSSLNISWRRPNISNGIINKYSISVDDDQKREFTRHLECVDCQSTCNTDKKSVPDQRNFFRNQETFNILFTDLKPYTNYTIVVQAYALSGYSETKEAVFETSEDVPHSVEDVQVIDVTSTSFTVKWSKPDEYRGNTRYTVIVTDLVSNDITTNDCGYKVTECLIDGLDAYRSYRFIVNATNQAGYSKTEPLNTTTKEDNPSSIKNVTVTTVTSTSVTLRWSKPEQYQGNTSYSVRVQDSISRKTSVKECGYQVTRCEVQGLHPYRSYELTVIGANTIGNTQGSPRLIQTKEAKPGPVESFTVWAENDRFKPRTIVLNWKPPTQKNGVILNYEIHYKAKQLFNVGVGRPDHLKVSEDSRTRTILVSPEQKYIVQIAAVNGAGYGQKTERIIKVPAGVLPKPKERTPMTRQSTKHPVSDRKRQIAIELPMMFLCDNTYGEIKHTGILATKTIAIKRAPMEGDDIGIHPKWSQTSVSILTYRVTGESWKPDCQSGLTKTDFVVGNDRNCENNHHLHCNGYLRPNTKYRFKVFVCTEAGCTYLDYSLPISTDAEESSNLLTICIGVALLLIIIGIAGFILYRIRNRHTCRFVKRLEPEHTVTGTVELSVEANRNRPIKLCNFEHHIARLHQDSNIGFSEEYKVIKRLSPKYSTKAAERESCRIKNRYTNVLPFDHTRVKLLPVDDDEGSEYINANYLAGYNSKREYIAAQGPLPATLDDFWRMIWEHHISVAVMLTQCKEKNTTKCERYWPETNEPIYFGDLIVRMRSESVLPDYVIRIIDVQLGIKKRTVKQFHFLKWPDFGCPEKTWLLLNFVTAVRAHIPNTPNGPMLVHCSAGVGRTGTFVAVDVLLQKIRDSDEVDIFDLVLEMRENRPLMVQTENQYVYIHDCIRDALMDDTEDEESLNENIYENDVIYENT
ncbi:receptor-type tyrosine-protein phosphatase eta [Patella vulgata]|uniref:receptor-type tyrosine-protein phosphatase eta n=1 Tax=Patella vulgata TaxID=6465 RepID=UPI00217FB445|nr:receptor-type tyrosine-protein phosphatase eta [Patella vulgata]